MKGTFDFGGSKLSVNRLGFGAMRLAGPHAWGPPKDPAGAVAVLREAVALGVNHIDTSDYYGPYVVNRLIKEALYPYPKDLVLVTKVGYVRGADASWQPDFSKENLTRSVHDNLRHLSLDVLDVVNLRMSSPQDSIDRPLDALMDLQQQGLLKHIGMSAVSAAQVARARELTQIVCVQNLYNIASRTDDKMIDELADAGIAYVPFFPLGGFNPLQSAELDAVAKEMGITPMEVALAWLYQRAPNILLIPGTSSLAHLRSNMGAAKLELPTAIRARLDKIGSAPK